MDYSSFELSRKTPKDSFLQKFLVKDFEVKEILNTENQSNLCLSNYLETETSKGNNTLMEKPFNQGQPKYHSNQNNIDLYSLGENKTIDSYKPKKISSFLKNRSVNQPKRDIKAPLIYNATPVSVIKSSTDKPSKNVNINHQKKPISIDNNPKLPLNNNQVKKKTKLSNKVKKIVSKEFIERLAKPKQYDNFTDIKSKKKDEIIDGKTITLPNDILVKLKNKKNNLKDNSNGINSRNRATNNVENSKGVDKLFSRIKISSILNTDCENNNMDSLETLPTTEIISNRKDLKSNTKMTSYTEYPLEKGFIKNKYKYLLEKLKI